MRKEGGTLIKKGKVSVPPPGNYMRVTTFNPGDFFFSIDLFLSIDLKVANMKLSGECST